MGCSTAVQGTLVAQHLRLHNADARPTENECRCRLVLEVVDECLERREHCIARCGEIGEFVDGDKSFIVGEDFSEVVGDGVPVVEPWSSFVAIGGECFAEFLLLYFRRVL